jgi:hypothetical protein
VPPVLRHDGHRPRRAPRAHCRGHGLESGAQRLGLWRYTDQMPTVRVAGHDISLLPIVQVTALPAWAAARGRADS